MKMGIDNRQTRLRLAGFLVLLVGLGSGMFIYLTAADVYDSGFGYEIIEGKAYPIRPEDSKSYRHDLELYGGKLNVVADEFNRWFAGLWHGKTLAFTVACCTVLISLILFIAASHVSSGLISRRQ